MTARQVFITVEQECSVGLFSIENLVRLRNHVRYCFRCCITGHSEKVSGSADPKIFKENFVEFEIVILARMDEDMIYMLVEFSNHVLILMSSGRVPTKVMTFNISLSNTRL